MILRAAGLCCTLLACCSCVPWTVRPIESTEDANAKKPMDAAAFVDSVWTSKLLPAITASAVDVREPAGSSAHRAVSGVARILSVDTGSQSGTIRIDLLPADGTADAVIQIGPVLRGTSLRDAAGFIEFGQFANQIQFAAVANELNARVLRDVIPAARAIAKPGAVISFTGTHTAESGQLPRIIPIKVERQP